MKSQNSSHECSKIFMHIANSVLILIGIGMIGHGVYDVITTGNTGVPGIITGSRRSPAAGINEIVSGCTSLIAGLCGLAGIILKNQHLILAYGLLLIVAVIVNTASLIMLSAVGEGIELANSSEIKVALITHYGSSDSLFSVGFTNSIDAHQSNNSCCGWSGADEPNLFENSPWYLVANKAGSSQSGREAAQTYPESCCTSLAVGQRKNLCTRATDVQLARKLGYIHFKDCLAKLLPNRTMRYVRLFEYVVLVGLQVVCLFFVIQLLIQAPPPVAAKEASQRSRTAAADSKLPGHSPLATRQPNSPTKAARNYAGQQRGHRK